MTRRQGWMGLTLGALTLAAMLAGGSFFMGRLQTIVEKNSEAISKNTEFLAVHLRQQHHEGTAAALSEINRRLGSIDHSLKTEVEKSLRR